MGLLVGCNPITDPVESVSASPITVKVYWVSTCGYCRKQMDILQDIHEEIQGEFLEDFVEIVGVNFAESNDAIMEYVTENGITFRIQTGGSPPPIVAYPITEVLISSQTEAVMVHVGVIDKVALYNILIRTVNRIQWVRA